VLDSGGDTPSIDRPASLLDKQRAQQAKKALRGGRTVESVRGADHREDVEKVRTAGTLGGLLLRPEERASNNLERKGNRQRAQEARKSASYRTTRRASGGSSRSVHPTVEGEKSHALGSAPREGASDPYDQSARNKSKGRRENSPKKTRKKLESRNHRTEMTRSTTRRAYLWTLAKLKRRRSLLRTWIEGSALMEKRFRTGKPRVAPTKVAPVSERREKKKK